MICVPCVLSLWIVHVVIAKFTRSIPGPGCFLTRPAKNRTPTSPLPTRPLAPPPQHTRRPHGRAPVRSVSTTRLHQTTNQQNISSRTPRPRPDITHADDRNRCRRVVALNACKSREAMQRPQRVALLIRMATRGAPASDAQICSTSEKCTSTSVPEAVPASGPEAIPSRTWSSST